MYSIKFYKTNDEFVSKKCFKCLIVKENKNKMKNGKYLAMIALCIVTVKANDDEGFLNATCNDAKDCYVLDDPNDGLHLACWHNVNKCKCDNTFRSNFHLKWENNQCLMSKYGPCGQKGDDLVVGCQDGFVCVENRCRDPANTKAVKLTPFIFESAPCELAGCRFSDELQLTCSEDRCSCEKIYVADRASSYWDIRNYDGDNDCSTGKFGPCGTNNGITITCHGAGIECVNGTCLDPNHLISDNGEECASIKNCKEGLECSPDSICIEPFSLGDGKRCAGKRQCEEGLECRRNGPWSSAFCQKSDQESP